MIELRVGGMGCAHCVRAVTEAIRAADPAARVEIDLEAGRVRAETRLDAAALAQAVAAAGYDPAP